MMNKKLKDLIVSILVAYIGIGWLLALLLFSYEFILGPMFNALSPEINSSISGLNLSENQVITQIDQSVPIPLNQFTIEMLILIVPSSILFGLLYAEAIKENDDE